MRPVLAAVLLTAVAAEQPPPVAPPPAGDIWSQVRCESRTAGCEVGVGSVPADRAGNDVVKAAHNQGAASAVPPGNSQPVCSISTEIRPEIREDWIARGQLKPGQRFVLRTCEPGGRDWIVLNPGQDPRTAPAVANPAEVAAEARDRLNLPTVRLGMSPVGSQLVGLPTWLWVESDSWAPVSRTVSVPGVSATATARPVSVEWSTGDGGSVVCAGPGTPYSPDTPPEAASPDCGHTFRVISPRGGFVVAARVAWSVSWAGAGQSGVSPDLVTGATTTVVVDAAPAVNVLPGAG